MTIPDIPILELDTIEKIVNLLKIRHDPAMQFVRRDAAVAAFDKYSDHDLVRHLIHAAAGLLDAFPEIQS